MRRRIDTEALLVPILAVVFAMLVGMLLIYGIGYDAMYAYTSLVYGAIGSPSAIGQTLLRAAPIILTGLSVMVAFRAGLFNIGGTGQAVMGLLFAGFVAVKFDALPGASHWIIALA